MDREFKHCINAKMQGADLMSSGAGTKDGMWERDFTF